MKQPCCICTFLSDRSLPISLSLFRSSLSPSLSVFLSFSVFTLSLSPSLSVFSLSISFCLPSFCLYLIIISFILSLLFVKASRFSFILAACQLYKYCCSELLDMSLVLDIVALCLFLTTVTANSRTLTATSFYIAVIFVKSIIAVSLISWYSLMCRK